MRPAFAAVIPFLVMADGWYLSHVDLGRNVVRPLTPSSSITILKTEVGTGFEPVCKELQDPRLTTRPPDLLEAITTTVVASVFIWALEYPIWYLAHVDPSTYHPRRECPIDLPSMIPLPAVDQLGHARAVLVHRARLDAETAA
jgi:hypothetical protein